MPKSVSVDKLDLGPVCLKNTKLGFRIIKASLFLNVVYTCHKLLQRVQPTIFSSPVFRIKKRLPSSIPPLNLLLLKSRSASASFPSRGVGSQTPPDSTEFQFCFNKSPLVSARASHGLRRHAVDSLYRRSVCLFC